MRDRGWILMFLALGFVVFVLLVGAVAGWVGGQMGRRPVEPPKIADTATVVRQVQSLAQLATVKYVLEKVVVIEDAKWFGETRLIMVAHGVAKAGFDLSGIQPGDIRADGDHLKIRLPKPKLTDVYLDDRRTEIVEHTTGVLRQFDKELEQGARRQALDRIRIAAVDAGIYREAEERARLQITALALQMGFSKVEVEVKGP